jgi:hypothetical protein
MRKWVRQAEIDAGAGITSVALPISGSSTVYLLGLTTSRVPRPVGSVPVAGEPVGVVGDRRGDLDRGPVWELEAAEDRADLASAHEALASEERRTPHDELLAEHGVA